jgi:glucosamine--fructose-6-phosphate aminotransferase (isomerizing)
MSVSALRDQVFSLPELIRETTWEVEDQTRSALSTPDILSLRLALITGSGDSNIAARAAQFAWQELGGIPTFADDAMTAARYRLDGIADGQRFRPLVVAVSSSGEVARVVEAAQRARGDGAFVLAVSSGNDNRLGSSADSVLNVAAPPHPSAPGVRSYAMSLLGLFHLAIRIGEVRGRYTMDEAGELRRQIAGLADAVESTLEAAAATAERIAFSRCGAWPNTSAPDLAARVPPTAPRNFLKRRECAPTTRTSRNSSICSTSPPIPTSHACSSPLATARPAPAPRR